MKTYHIKMTHTGNKPALLDDNDKTILQGFDDSFTVYKMWCSDEWKAYSEKFDMLNREQLDQQCLNILRKYYDESIRNFKPTSDKIGSVVELETTHGYSIAIHYNARTLNQLN